MPGPRVCARVCACVWCVVKIISWPKLHVHWLVRACKARDASLDRGFTAATSAYCDDVHASRDWYWNTHLNCMFCSLCHISTQIGYQSRISDMQ